MLQIVHAAKNLTFKNDPAWMPCVKEIRQETLAVLLICLVNVSHFKRINDIDLSRKDFFKFILPRLD